MINSYSNTANLWSNGGFRKRKLTNADPDIDNSEYKKFLTEEKVLQDLKELSLDVSKTSSNSENDSDEQKNSSAVEYHLLLQDLKIDPFHDDFLKKFRDHECRKFSMQIVPYMPIHPAQLNPTSEKKEENDEPPSVSPTIASPQNDDHLFKRPFPVLAYIVEEPCETTTKRPIRMKRSYSQSIRSNNNLCVVELQDDPNDYSFYHTKDDYLIVEPSTPVLSESPTNNSSAFSLSAASSVRIRECFDFSPFIPVDNDDKMDDESYRRQTICDRKSRLMSLASVAGLTTTMTATNSSRESSVSSTDDLQPAPSPTVRQFDLKIARDAFVNCVQAENLLLLREYVHAYEELCVFVSSLGSVFEWAIKDLTNKLLVLKEHQRLDPINYQSIQSMITYEVESGRTKTRDTSLFLPSGKPLPNGCRTLLRLHRALAFISSFLSQMRVAPDDASSASIAWNAYSTTMANFHSWPVRHTIHVAIKLTLPSRQDLINKLISHRTPEEIDSYADDIIRSCNIIERTTQQLFESYQISKLS